MKYTILQSSESDCGFCVLKVLLANIHKNKRYLYLENKRKKPYSMLDLKKMAKKYNVDLNGYKVEDLAEMENLKFPLICQLKKPTGYHFVILEKIIKNKYYIFDPSIGELSLSEDDFNLSFANHILAIDSFSDYALPKYKPSLNWNLCFSVIVNFFTGFFLAMCILNSAKGQNNYISICFSTLLIFTVFLQTFLNSKYLDSCYKKYSLDYSNLAKISSFANKRIANITQIPLKLIIMTVIIIIILQSSPLGILNLIFLAYTIWFYIYYEKKLKVKTNEIEFFESMQFDIYNVMKKAKKIVFQKYVVQFMLLVFNVIISFYSMNATGLIGVDYLIFITSIELALFKIVYDLNKIKFSDLLYKSALN